MMVTKAFELPPILCALTPAFRKRLSSASSILVGSLGSPLSHETALAVNTATVYVSEQKGHRVRIVIIHCRRTRSSDARSLSKTRSL